MPCAYGTINYTAIVKCDDAVEKVKTDEIFTEYQYQVYRADESYFFTKGEYLIVDGGHLRWKCLQCGLRHSSEKFYFC